MTAGPLSVNELRGVRCAAVLGLLLCAGAGMVQGQERSTRTVSGTVIDAVRAIPLAGALVSAGQPMRNAVTDSAGRFVLHGVDGDAGMVLVEHDLLDSLGVGPLRHEIPRGSLDIDVRVETPSRAALWRRFCGSEMPRDTGAVFGIVRRTVGHVAVAEARVSASWDDVGIVRGEGLQTFRVGGAVVADADGRFVICGVPLRRPVRLSTGGDGLSVATSEATIPSHGFLRADLWVRRTGVDTALTSLLVTVADGAGGPLAGAHVMIAGVDSATTDSVGAVRLDGIPLGSQDVHVRALGYQPALVSVAVHADGESAIAIRLGSVTVIDSVLVTARSVTARFVRDLEERMSKRLGKFVDSTAVLRRGTLVGALSSVASVRVNRAGQITLGAMCTPGVIIDDQLIDPRDVAAEFRMLNMNTIGVIEVYEHPSLMPMELAMRANRPHCLILIWTKRKFP